MARELISTEEAAAVLALPEATLRFWRHIRKGPRSVRLGKQVKYDRAEVETWLDEEFKKQT